MCIRERNVSVWCMHVYACVCMHAGAHECPSVCMSKLEVNVDIWYMHVHRLLCVCAHGCTCMPISVCVGDSDQCGCLPRSLSTLGFEARSLTGSPLTWLGWMVSELWGCTCLCPSSAGVPEMHSCMVDGDLNAYTYACVAGTLPGNPSSQILNIFLKM